MWSSSQRGVPEMRREISDLKLRFSVKMNIPGIYLCAAIFCTTNVPCQAYRTQLMDRCHE